MENVDETYDSLIKETECVLNQMKKKCLITGFINSNDPRQLLPQNGLWLIQRILFYSISMNEGILGLMNSKNVLPTVHLIRANFEVAGILANFHAKLERFYLGELDFASMDLILKRYALGSRSLGLKDIPEPISILNGIDAADKWYKRESKKLGYQVDREMFKEAYSFLSEFTHPNFHGLVVVSSFKDGVVKRANFEDSHAEHAKHLLGYLRISNTTFNHFYDACLNLLKENETLAIISE